MKRVLALLVLLSTCLAAQVISHEIRISLHDDGSAYVEQEYLVRLVGTDKAAFTQLLKTKPGFSDLAPYSIAKVIAYPSQDENVVVEMTGSDFGVVTLQYSIPKIVESVEQVGKQQLAGITAQAFTFYDGTTITLPYDPPTTLKIAMPNTLRLAREVTPPAYSVTEGFDSTGQKVTNYEWNYRKPFTTNKFQVLYEKEVPLQSQLSLSAITQEIRDKYGNPVYLLAALILIVIGIWYRSEISMLLTESFGGEITMEEENQAVPEGPRPSPSEKPQ